MIIQALSDTHTFHQEFIIKPCDIIIHCGDFSNIGGLKDCTKFLDWYDTLPAKHKIFICGNHELDIPYKQPDIWNDLLKNYPNITYLQNEGIIVEGIKFWGRPGTPIFDNWGFMLEPGSKQMISSFDIIPEDTDILITHGPPREIRDYVSGGRRAGCYDMRNWLNDGKNKPKLILCGHLHNGRGVEKYNNTTIVNCSVLNDFYNHLGQPLLINYSNDTISVEEEE